MPADQAPPTPFSAEAWKGATSAHWLANAQRLDATLEPVLDPLFEHAAVSAGDRVLDIGCGRGATTWRAARAAGPSGSVTAIDISEGLIAAASALAAPEGAAPISWRVGDAQHMDLSADGFDLAISRFGVMFFDDPVAAFTNIAGAVRSGGRLAMATWRPRDQSPFGSAAADATNAALEQAGYPVEAGDPTTGPYSFGVDEYVHDVLGRAGWAEIALHPYRLPLHFGGPGASPEEAVALMATMPGYTSAMAQYDERGQAIAAEALAAAFRRHHDGTGVRLDAALVIITARRP